MNIVIKCFLLVLFLVKTTEHFSQGTLPIYVDYLSDNIYLIHPAAAGVGDCTKLRFTARQQWAGVPDAPALQTISYHSKFGEYSNAAYGLVLFNDKNGYHSQKGVQGTYAYHLDLNGGEIFNQLSFGLSFTAVQNQADQRTFMGDPSVAGIVVSEGYFNADFGMAYHLGGFSSYFTVKNLLLNARNTSGRTAALDLRNFIFSAGYYFGRENLVQFEPSIMLQFKEGVSERIADVNMKAYKTFNKTRFWVALSYRRNFDENAIENLQYFSPLLGVNYNKFMFSYTYTKQSNDIVLTSSGFHQVSLGFDFSCIKPRAAACPNINSAFGSF